MQIDQSYRPQEEEEDGYKERDDCLTWLRFWLDWDLGACWDLWQNLWWRFSGGGKDGIPQIKLCREH